MAAELVYIVIPVHSVPGYNTVEVFRECIRTLKENTDNFRLIVVNDASDAEGATAIDECAYSVGTSSYVIKTYKQRWFSRAINLGLRLVRSPFAVTLNSDCVLGAGWLEEMLVVRDEAATQVGKVGLVGSEMSMDELRRWQNISVPSTPGNPGYVTGHCWLLSMQAMYECSASRGMPGWYLNEQQQIMIHIRSDNEICRVMNSLGWATVRSFKASVGHHGGRSWGHDLARISHISLAEVND